MNGEVVGPVAAFAGGLLSFLSPCVLPLVPSYLGFLTGMTLDEMKGRRHRAATHALLFIAGFSLVFILLGAGATMIGTGLRAHRTMLERVGGVIVIAFGLYSMGLLRLPWLDRDRRWQMERKPLGHLGSVLVGMAFAAGWTPCIGPVLGPILIMASDAASVGHGMGLLGAYSAGLAVPFIAAALALDVFREWFQRYRRWMPWVQRAGGAVLVAVGVLLVTGEFTVLATWLQRFTPDFIQSRV